MTAKTKKIFSACLCFSLGLHVFFFFYVNVQVKGKQATQIYAWPHILRPDQLRSPAKADKLPDQISLSAERIRRSYFIKPFLSSATPPGISPKTSKPLFLAAPPEKAAEPANLVFLWEKNQGLGLGEKETPYRAWLSPHGKVILLYPEKLNLDSHRNISQHNFLQESVYSLQRDFFWTNFETLVE